VLRSVIWVFSLSVLRLPSKESCGVFCAFSCAASGVVDMDGPHLLRHNWHHQDRAPGQKDFAGPAWYCSAFAKISAATISPDSASVEIVFVVRSTAGHAAAGPGTQRMHHGGSGVNDLPVARLHRAA
jgi:hypothetical protein